jgi:hypothetical protein
MSPQRARTRLGVLVLVSTLGSGGCAAAGLAAGPLFSAVVAVGDRRVERTLPVDLPTAWTASVDALGRSGIRLGRADRSKDPWVLEGAGETVTVDAELSRITPTMTRIGLRVEAGRVTADKRTAEEILNQVVASLPGSASAAPTAEPVAKNGLDAQALTSLEQEVRRLRREIEQTKGARHDPSLSSESTVRKDLFTGARVLVVPASYGVPTYGVPLAAAVSAALPAMVTPSPSPDQPSPVAGASPAEAEPAEVLAGPLEPVGALKPVPGLTVRQGGSY